MNCRDFIIEFEERRGNLTEAATLHVKICADCQKTSREQTQVWLMIDNLRRVDAPNDFDFRVKARIAQGKPADSQFGFFPALRYVLPLGLIVLILGAVVFNSSYFPGNATPPIAKTAVPPMLDVAENPASNSFATPDRVAAINNPLQSSANENNAFGDLIVKPTANERGNQFIADKSTRKILTESRKPNPANDSGGGSRVFSSKPPESLRFPVGINPNQTVEPLSNAGNSNTITDAQILSFIGIEIVSEKDKKKVKTVKPESLAERSGIEAGDFIEAIDDKQISGETVQMKTFEVKKLTVVRDAKRIEIVLQNKSN